MGLGLLPDTRGDSLDSHATVRDPGKMHKGSNLVNDGLLHECELVKETTKLLCPKIHTWVEAVVGRPGRRIRDIGGTGSHAVSGRKTQSLFVS